MTNDEIRHQLGIVWRDCDGPGWLKHGAEFSDSITPSREHFIDLEQLFGEWPVFYAQPLFLGLEEWCFVEALGLVVVEPFRVSE